MVDSRRLKIPANDTGKKDTDPGEWAREKMADKRKTTFLKPGEEPSIKGIKGYPSNAGYIKWLKRFQEKFDREDLLLVADRNKKEFSILVRKEIQIEIEKQETLLIELERSPEAVRVYLYALKENIRKWKQVLRIDSERQNEKINDFIRQTEETIEEYAALLMRLRLRQNQK
jgi:hypothetical protein